MYFYITSKIDLFNTQDIVFHHPGRHKYKQTNTVSQLISRKTQRSFGIDNDKKRSKIAIVFRSNYMTLYY